MWLWAITEESCTLESSEPLACYLVVHCIYIHSPRWRGSWLGSLLCFCYLTLIAPPHFAFALSIDFHKIKLLLAWRAFVALHGVFLRSFVVFQCFFLASELKEEAFVTLVLMWSEEVW